MPRPVAMRVNYREDAGFLLRLEAAVSKDDRQSPEWRATTEKMIRQLSMRLLEADAGRKDDKKSSKSIPK